METAEPAHCILCGVEIETCSGSNLVCHVPVAQVLIDNVVYFIFSDSILHTLVGLADAIRRDNSFK